jgi:hypothetical protein
MRGLLGFLAADFKTRALALVLAVVTWVSVYRESNEPVTAPAAVEVTRAADVVVMAVEDEKGQPLRSILLRLIGPRGQRSDLRDLRLVRPVEMDSGPGPQTVTFDVTEELLRLPPKFRLLDAAPARVRVRIDRADEVVLGLEPAEPGPKGEEWRGYVRGAPAPGFRLVSVAAEPDQIRVRGPKGVLAKRSRIGVQPADIGGWTAGTRRVQGRLVPDIEGATVSTSAQITLEVRIAEDPQEATFAVRLGLVQSEEYARDFSAEAAVKEVEILARGPASAINELKARPELLVADVDVAAMRPEECQPLDDKELIATRPIEARFRARFPGHDAVELLVKTPEKAEVVMTFRRRPKPPEPPK